MGREALKRKQASTVQSSASDTAERAGTMSMEDEAEERKLFK